MPSVDVPPDAALAFASTGIGYRDAGRFLFRAVRRRRRGPRSQAWDVG